MWLNINELYRDLWTTEKYHNNKQRKKIISSPGSCEVLDEPNFQIIVKLLKTMIGKVSAASVVQQLRIFYAEMGHLAHKNIVFFVRRRADVVYKLIAVGYITRECLFKRHLDKCGINSLLWIHINTVLSQGCGYYSVIFFQEECCRLVYLAIYFICQNYIPNCPMGLLNIWVLTMKNGHSFNTNFVNCLNNSLCYVIVFSTSTFNF